MTVVAGGACRKWLANRPFGEAIGQDNAYAPATHRQGLIASVARIRQMVEAEIAPAMPAATGLNSQVAQLHLSSCSPIWAGRLAGHGLDLGDDRGQTRQPPGAGRFFNPYCNDCGAHGVFGTHR